MTNTKNALEGYIKDFGKVCKVSNIISQVCQLRGYDWLEKELLNRWGKTVLNNQDEDAEVAFILAKLDFIKYLENYFMKDEPIIVFLIDAIKYI